MKAMAEKTRTTEYTPLRSPIKCFGGRIGHGELDT